MIRFATITLFVVSVILTSGCGGSGGNGDPLPGKGGTGGGTGGTSVVVTPAGIGQVWEGTTVQFSAQVIAVRGPTDVAIVQTVKTQPGARTGAVDPKTGKIYLPTAAYTIAATGKPTPTPGTFAILVVSPN